MFQFDPAPFVPYKNKEILEGIGDVCLEKGVFVIDDLIYRDLTFDREELFKIDRNFICTLTLKQKKSEITYGFGSFKSVDFNSVLVNI